MLQLIIKGEAWGNALLLTSKELAWYSWWSIGVVTKCWDVSMTIMAWWMIWLGTPATVTVYTTFFWLVINLSTYQCTQCMHCLLFRVDRCTWVGGLCRCKQLFQHMCHSHRQVDTLCSVCRKLHHLHSPHCTDTQQRHRTAEGVLVYQVDIHIVLCGPGHGILHLFHTDFLTHTHKGSSSYH